LMLRDDFDGWPTRNLRLDAVFGRIHRVTLSDLFGCQGMSGVWSSLQFQGLTWSERFDGDRQPMTINLISGDIKCVRIGFRQYARNSRRNRWKGHQVRPDRFSPGKHFWGRFGRLVLKRSQANGDLVSQL
jgi:hypothetical protein